MSPQGPPPPPDAEPSRPAPPAFEAFFNASPNAYMVLDRHLRFVAANDAYLRSVGGATRESILGRHLFDAFPSNPDDPNDLGVRQVRSSLERVLRTGRPDHLAVIIYTIPVHTPDGVVHEERYWSATHTPLHDDDGEVAFVLQHTVDVTELQQTKQALRAAEAALVGDVPAEQIEQGIFRRAQLVQQANQTLDTERRHLRKLFEQAPGFVAILEGERHVFTLVNAAYHQLIGHRDILGLDVREALPEVEQQGFFGLLEQVFTTGEPFVGRGLRVLLQRSPNGPLDEVFVDFVYQPIVEPDGTTSGIFVQGHDVTEEYRARAELHELNATLEQRVERRTAELEARNRELQSFAYVASHDLQEPLRKIRTFADLLESDYGDALDVEAHHFVRRMRDAAERMQQLLADLLTYSRVATHQQPLTPVALEETAREVLDDLDLAIERSEAHVEVAGTATALGDTHQLRQLLNHLLLNAIKFRRPGIAPRVRVRLAEDDGTARLVVEDNGIGFEAKYAEQIFEPFKRLHGRDAYEGTGMGLSICRRIVERHDGTITAESAPGEGSRFVVTLPAAA